MPAIVRARVRKEASPEQLGWRARLAAAEPELASAFLSWVVALRTALTEAAVTQAVIGRSADIFDQVLEAVRFQPVLAPVAQAEATRSFDELLYDLDPKLHMSFDLHDANFDTAVREHEARLVREVTQETRRAIMNIVERGYRDGHPPADIARDIRALVGLTSRQAQAVLTFMEGQRKNGTTPQQVVDRSMRYAAKLRGNRAKLIARTETARAATQGRVAGYQQAARRGLFDPATAELEWSAVQQDPTEICGHLNGTRVPFGSTFAGLLPPAHPGCRCAVVLRLPARRSEYVSPLLVTR